MIVFNEIRAIIAKHRPMIQIEIAESNIMSFMDYFDKLDYLQYGICNFKIIQEKGRQKEIGDFLFVPKEQKIVFEETHLKS